MQFTTLVSLLSLNSVISGPVVQGNGHSLCPRSSLLDIDLLVRLGLSSIIRVNLDVDLDLDLDLDLNLCAYSESLGRYVDVAKVPAGSARNGRITSKVNLKSLGPVGRADDMEFILYDPETPSSGKYPWEDGRHNNCPRYRHSLLRLGLKIGINL